MAKKLLSQLESLARRVQVWRLKKKYPNTEGIKMGTGFLWQHPNDTRQKILKLCQQKLGLDNSV